MHISNKANINITTFDTNFKYLLLTPAAQHNDTHLFAFLLSFVFDNTTKMFKSLII